MTSAADQALNRLESIPVGSPSSVLEGSQALLISTRNQVLLSSGTCINVSYVFESIYRLKDKFSYNFSFEVLTWNQSVDEESFFVYLHKLAEKNFLPLISKDYRLILIEGETLAPESKVLYLRCPIRFSYGQSEGSSVDSAFRFDLFTEKSQTINRFNAKGFTENFRNFDKSPNSLEFQKISAVESFFTTPQFLVVGPSVSSKEVASFRLVKTFPFKQQTQKLPKKVVVTKSGKKTQVEAKPSKQVYKKPVVKKITLAIARGFVSL